MVLALPMEVAAVIRFSLLLPQPAVDTGLHLEVMVVQEVLEEVAAVIQLPEALEPQTKAMLALVVLLPVFLMVVVVGVQAKQEILMVVVTAVMALPHQLQVHP
jgi:hypothetical protein